MLFPFNRFVVSREGMANVIANDMNVVVTIQILVHGVGGCSSKLMAAIFHTSFYK